MNAIIVLFMLITVGVSIASANPTYNVRTDSPVLFRKAMDDINQMHFESAINKLLRVRTIHPSNANLDYLLGKCYLYGDVSAEKAAYYLNKATNCISLSYESWDVSEECAPIETVYLLARSYEKTEHYDLAYDCYQRFLALLEGGPVKPQSRTHNMVNRAAENCKKAAQIQERIAFNQN